MSTPPSKPPSTSSSKPPLEPVQLTIGQIVAYLNSQGDRDISVSGLLNWFSMLRRDNIASVFDANGHIKPALRGQYAKHLKDLLDAKSEKSQGRAHDGMIMGVANDLVAQVELAANFRKLKIGHHFAKSRYNITQMGKGAIAPKNSDSILEEYTSVFLANAEHYVS